MAEEGKEGGGNRVGVKKGGGGKERVDKEKSKERGHGRERRERDTQKQKAVNKIKANDSPQVTYL